ncbi:GGDEF domain-containing protein [Legionella shakespearei]|uniref:diguanylate cyclase n=1 Tax=Legionella shakespearei DSM 23087 TaxID=1122169 RepID=A0A0W0YHV3_9GAMM|nr:GGDEF domain-containing protein [Legionella shakespearei]KTD56434.1 two component response regulator with GGDEF domain protein [Legionella shakespearei DSM 23087]
MDLFEAEIKQRLMNHLFAHTIRVIIFTLIFALLIVSYIDYRGTQIEATGWLICLSIVVLCRVIIALLAPKARNKTPCYILFVLSGFLLGSLLGYFYWAFYYDISQFERMILLLFFAGLAAGATITLAASPLSFVSLILPVYIPAFIRNVTDSTVDAKFVALMIVIYMIFILIVFYANKKMLRDNIQLLLGQNELNQKLSIISITDELTNLANRRYFQERLNKDWIYAKRGQLPISLLIIDIDFFKACNDNYGHLYGDICLKEVAKIVSDHTKRKTDLAARYGGDELVVILNHCSLDDTKRFAEKIMESIKKLAMKHEYSLICDYLTVTIGAANMVPGINEDEDVLFNKADKALYQAKLKGRNTYVVG